MNNEQLVKEEDGKLYVYLTPFTGAWSPSVMTKMSNLLSVNISGCTKVNPDMFVKSVAECPKITNVFLNGCKQFTELHLVKLLNSIPNLEVFEALDTTGILSVNVSEVLSKCKNIRVLKVMPKFEEKRNWSNLIRHYYNIDFGVEIQKIND